jgi:hypothetical protein
MEDRATDSCDSDRTLVAIDAGKLASMRLAGNAGCFFLADQTLEVE